MATETGTPHPSIERGEAERLGVRGKSITFATGSTVSTAGDGYEKVGTRRIRAGGARRSAADRSGRPDHQETQAGSCPPDPVEGLHTSGLS